MTQTLYSLRTDPGGYRITKFVDGEVESSYLTSTDACECPAGHRHTCRHRQMLPQMLAHGIADTHWFMDWDRSGSIVDFQGGSKRLYDQLAAVATGEISETLSVRPQPIFEPYPTVGEALTVVEDTTTCPGCGSTGFAQSALGPGRCEFCDGTFGGNPPTSEEVAEATTLASPEPAPQQQSGRSWRRL